MKYAIYGFSILTWLFCILFIIARNYSSLLANIFLGLEIACLVIELVFFVVGLIKIKREERKLREMALDFLMPNKDKEEK